MSKSYHPDQDGVDHINIYSQARTPVGRWMSNFAEQDITTEDGPFASIEAYWYWLGTGDERLRKLGGFAAKQLGKQLPRTRELTEEEFRAKIKRALSVKAEGRPDFVKALRDNPLPLAHYYVFQGFVKPAGYDWLVEWWEQLREEKSMKTLRLAVIGTRDLESVPGRATRLFMATIEHVARKAFQAGNRLIVHTGAAPGCDQLGAELALQEGAEVLLVLPVAYHEKDWCGRLQAQHPGKVQVRVYSGITDQAWLQSVQQFHPAPDRLGHYPRLLMARNYGILMDPRVGAVVALPGGAPDKGGTGQGIRIAAHYGIPCYNLSLESRAGWPQRTNEQGCVEVEKLLARPVNNTVYVFGSNESGFHGAGLAGWLMRGQAGNTWRQDEAFQKAMQAPPGSPDRVGKKAVFGVATGLQQGREGYSYGIITVTKPGAKRSITLPEIKRQLEELWWFAGMRPDLRFELGAIAIGYAGYTKVEIRALLLDIQQRRDCPDNLHIQWDLYEEN